MNDNITVQAKGVISLLIENDEYRSIKNFSLRKLDKDVVLYIDSVPVTRYEVKKMFNIVIDGDVKDISATSNQKISLTCQDVTGNISINSGSVNCMDVDGDINVNGSLNCMDIDGNVTATDCKINAMNISKLTKN